jgi:hypothetical protein
MSRHLLLCNHCETNRLSSSNNSCKSCLKDCGTCGKILCPNCQEDPFNGDDVECHWCYEPSDDELFRAYQPCNGLSTWSKCTMCKRGFWISLKEKESGKSLCKFCTWSTMVHKVHGSLLMHDVRVLAGFVFQNSIWEWVSGLDYFLYYSWHSLQEPHMCMINCLHVEINRSPLVCFSVLMYMFSGGKS